MIEVLSYVSQINHADIDWTTLFHILEKDGWTPVFHSLEKNFCTMAGIEFMESLRYPRELLYRGFLEGDIFFRDRDVYYFSLLFAGRYGYKAKIKARNIESMNIAIGIISPYKEKLNERILEFADAIKRALQNASNEDCGPVEWQRVQTDQSMVANFGEDEQTAPTFTVANLDPVEVEAAKVLADKDTRQLLSVLSQAGFVTELDISRKGREDEIGERLSELKQSGLISEEYLLQCKKTSTQLSRLRNIEQLQSPNVRDLVCPRCNASFAEEHLTRGYTPTELGRKMISGSHWMTLWITDILNKVGIPLEGIFWNVAELGEEVDIIVHFLGQIWIFELKDREFGAGDAYPLNYRAVRYKAHKIIIVTTDKVANEAKRIFQDLGRNRAADREPIYLNREPIYIEGLDFAFEILKQEASNTAIFNAAQRLRVLSERSGYNLFAVLSSKYGGKFGSDIDETELYL